MHVQLNRGNGLELCGVVSIVVSVVIEGYLWRGACGARVRELAAHNRAPVRAALVQEPDVAAASPMSGRPRASSVSCAAAAPVAVAVAGEKVPPVQPDARLICVVSARMCCLG